MFQKTLLAVLLLIISTIPIFASEMVAVKDERFFVGPQSSQDADNILLYYRWLDYQGYFMHEARGFGLSYRIDREPQTEPGYILEYNNIYPSDRRYAASYTLYLYPTSGSAFIPNGDRLHIFGRDIRYAGIGSIFMHKRDTATTPYLYNADPQPFVYRAATGRRSYSFMHEGIFSPNQLTLLDQFYNQNGNLVDPEITDLFISGDNSGMLFAYILLRIKEARMDILRGIDTAIHSLINPQGTSSDTSPHNFIFSDGFDIYVFKFGNPNLRVYRDNIRGLTLITSHNSVHSNSESYLRRVFRNDSFLFQLPHSSLLYLPFQGDPVTFDYDARTTQITMHRPTNSPGVNWLSFPVLPILSAFPGTPITGLVPNGGDLPTKIYLEYGQSAEYDMNANPPWVYDPIYGFTDVATPNTAMKIRFQNPTIRQLDARGSIRPITNYSTLYPPPPPPLPGRWVTYNLALSQSIRDALGDHYGNVYAVYGENWGWDANIPSSWVNLQKPMEFGKTYEIYFTNTIPSFAWTDVRQTRDGSLALNEPASGKLPRKPQYFTYARQGMYEAIDIMSLSSNQENSVEIGVFADDICIGATRVDEFPVQLLAYTEGFENIPLTFKVLLSDGIVKKINLLAEVYSRDKGNYGDDYLIAGNIGHTAVMLSINNEDKDIKVPALISKHQVYPNPFNPSTTISFSITDNSMVSVEVYNIRGQRVKTLVTDSLPAGHHTLQWNGTDEYNKNISSGIYFYRILTDSHQTTGKMLLMK